MADVLEDVCKKDKVRCPKLCVMAKVLYPELSLPKSRDAYWDARKRLREEMVSELGSIRAARFIRPEICTAISYHRAYVRC